MSMKRKWDDLDRETGQCIGLVYDHNILKESLKHPRVSDRSLAVFRLLEAYDLLKYFTILKPKIATFEELCNFHSSDFIKYLREINSNFTPDDDVELDFGLGYDCPALDGIYDYCCAIAGSTLAAAKALLSGSADVVINWFGGWHHAQRDEAEGFCYINDICLGILELRKLFTNILYFDLDIHHGNGVENAFSCTKRVMTVSMHLYEPGFYPGTGSDRDVGCSAGSYYCVNVPLKSGASDSTFIEMFDWVLDAVLGKFVPDAVVIQCGADGLSGDPVGISFNLTESAYGHCVKSLIALKKPTLIVGGGGYHIANTARCWTYLTSIVAGTTLNTDIPEHENFNLYSPSFELPVSKSLRKDNNSVEYLNALKASIAYNLLQI